MNLNSDIKVITPDKPCQVPEQALSGCSRCSGGKSCLKCRRGFYDAKKEVKNTSLVTNVSKVVDLNVNQSVSDWSRQQKRGYQRVSSILYYWLSHDYEVLWICLTGSKRSNSELLAKHHAQLRREVEYKLGFHGIEHFQVKTQEGNGVLHIFWAFKVSDGFRRNKFYVSQKWLSKRWHKLHQAKIVWIKRVRRYQRGTLKYLSRYTVTQYCASQSGYERMSWSWRRTFDFPMVACWYWFKRLSHNRSRLLFWWYRFLRGQDIVVFLRTWSCGCTMNINTVRKLYSEYGCELWSFI
jgi:hypothetical protein